MTSALPPVSLSLGLLYTLAKQKHYRRDTRKWHSTLTSQMSQASHEKIPTGSAEILEYPTDGKRAQNENGDTSMYRENSELIRVSLI
jgi:hypothetical protein